MSDPGLIGTVVNVVVWAPTQTNLFLGLRPRLIILAIFLLLFREYCADALFELLLSGLHEQHVPVGQFALFHVKLLKQRAASADASALRTQSNL